MNRIIGRSEKMKLPFKILSWARLSLLYDDLDKARASAAYFEKEASEIKIALKTCEAGAAALKQSLEKLQAENTELKTSLLRVRALLQGKPIELKKAIFKTISKNKAVKAVSGQEAEVKLTDFKDVKVSNKRAQDFLKSLGHGKSLIELESEEVL